MTETRDDEQRAAEALARALDESVGGQEPQEGDPDVADLLRLADRVRATGGLVEPLETKVRDSIVDQALEKATPPRRRTLYWVAGALAASVAICVFGFLYSVIPQSQATTMESAYAAPTDALFEGPFPEDQSAAERMDLIVQARTRGYFDALIVERSEARARTAAIQPAGLELDGPPGREAQLGSGVTR